MNGCVSVSVNWGTGHTFLPRNLMFGLSNPADMRKTQFSFVSRFLTLFIRIFRPMLDDRLTENILKP